jgi:hypothetical protein
VPTDIKPKEGELLCMKIKVQDSSSEDQVTLVGFTYASASVEIIEWAFGDSFDCRRNE